MTPDEIKGLADAIKLATEKGMLEQASFIAVVISAAISAIALWFIRAQMKGGNDQLKILTDQVAAMQEANRALHQQMAVAEDRAAKELAISLMLTWEQRLQFQTMQVARLVQKLDHDQCKKLDGGQEFYIKDEWRDLAELCIPEDFLPLKLTDKGILIAGKTLIYLRFATVSYLNLIEAILTSWHQNIIDRDVIEDQFAFLRNDGENVLETFRTISGIDYYPSISEFLRRLKKIEDSSLPRPKDETPLQSALRRSVGP